MIHYVRSCLSGMLTCWRCSMRFLTSARACLAAMFLFATSAGVFAQQTYPTGPIGKITASFGHAKIESANASRPAELHQPLNNQERIVTNGGGVSVLLNTRVVLRIDGDTTLRVNEGVGQTNIELEHGTVQLFVGKRTPAM